MASQDKKGPNILSNSQSPIGVTPRFQPGPTEAPSLLPSRVFKLGSSLFHSLLWSLSTSDFTVTVYHLRCPLLHALFNASLHFHAFA